MFCPQSFTNQQVCGFIDSGMVGGMPVVVNLDVSTGIARQCREAQRDLVAA